MTELIVTTRQGRLEGQAANGVRSWKGIPYAAPPVGPLRFRAPAPPGGWEGIRSAAAYGPSCPQPAGGIGEVGDMSEDCLYLNIWAPGLPEPEREPLPVMVWIHGGAFETGSGSLPFYNGEQMARQGRVVVVTMNYRLGPFGFSDWSAFGVPDAAANVGLLDQIAALEWVQREIAAFGGDPARVTVFGESAGAMSIAALMAMPAARGLFSRAILQSGASQAAAPRQAQRSAAGLLSELGLSAGQAHKLRELPAGELVAAMSRMKQSLGGMMLPFQPVLDPASLPVSPAAAAEQGAAAKIPLLIGTNRDEGGMFFRPDSPPMPEAALGYALSVMTGMTDAARLVPLYPKDGRGQARMMTELYFWRGAVQFASAQSAHAPVWMYRFDWTDDSHPLLRQAIHAAEIPFVWGTLSLLEAYGVKLPPDAWELAAKMQEAWTAFAHGRPPLQDWPAYDPKRRETMIFGRPPAVAADPDGDRRELLGL
ncbi:carboxylesterase/lipase family protein [Paenibacillus spiritus]|uniref:Carboxylic ester hydrolase n=1 Tax=Paenibacillus spiritus TaxID=2496557 RepID=A0A5J5GAA2_9BACL|nr:carboxylesterase/lipase family protein [Paenibacillus spiritus]KAA9004958.1 carboxylesterase/lipase family protein [Paenibacillus spiritus]